MLRFLFETTKVEPASCVLKIAIVTYRNMFMPMNKYTIKIFYKLLQHSIHPSPTHYFLQWKHQAHRLLGVTQLKPHTYQGQRLRVTVQKLPSLPCTTHCYVRSRLSAGAGNMLMQYQVLVACLKAKTTITSTSLVFAISFQHIQVNYKTIGGTLLLWVNIWKYFLYFLISLRVQAKSVLFFEVFWEKS